MCQYQSIGTVAFLSLTYNNMYLYCAQKVALLFFFPFQASLHPTKKIPAYSSQSRQLRQNKIKPSSELSLNTFIFNISISTKTFIYKHQSSQFKNIVKIAPEELKNMLYRIISSIVNTLPSFPAQTTGLLADIFVLGVAQRGAVAVHVEAGVAGRRSHVLAYTQQHRQTSLACLRRL